MQNAFPGQRNPLKSLCSALRKLLSRQSTGTVLRRRYASTSSTSSPTTAPCIFFCIGRQMVQSSLQSWTPARRLIAAAAALQLVWVGLPSGADAFCLPAFVRSSTTTARRRCCSNGASQAALPSQPFSRDLRRRVHRTSVYPSWHTPTNGAAIDHHHRSRCAGVGSSAFTASSSGRSRRAARGGNRASNGALSMSVDELSVLGRDALMFLAATVVVVPACKKAKIR